MGLSVDSLGAFSFRPKFIHTIQMIYQQSTAWASTGNSQSLVQSLRQSQRISPGTLFDIQHYIYLCASDIILYLSNLEVSISNILQLFNHFSSLSGSELNFREIKDEIKLDIQRWTKLQLSMQARISTVKMNVLPQLNFLSFMTPP